jgi:hypothetical protein
MPKDDVVYLGHMLDTARKVVTRDLPALAKALERIVPPDEP